MANVRCEYVFKRFEKLLERLDEAEALYGTGNAYAALSKVGGAFTNLALIYSKGFITKDEWKDIAGSLHYLRESIINLEPPAEVFRALDRVRKTIEDIMLDKLRDCFLGGFSGVSGKS